MSASAHECTEPSHRHGLVLQAELGEQLEELRSAVQRVRARVDGDITELGSQHLPAQMFGRLDERHARGMVATREEVRRRDAADSATHHHNVRTTVISHDRQCSRDASACREPNVPTTTGILPRQAREAAYPYDSTASGVVPRALLLPIEGPPA